uniref:Uncharacterized protein n=1 Tax=Angiostrongylus cantonensis TaxID=6313 RepID=A0A0K0D762_ANGCA
MARLSSPSDDVACRIESEQPVIYEEVPYEMLENSGKAVESAAFISGPLPRVQSLEFDVDQLFQQLPDEQFTSQQCVNGEQMREPSCSTSGTASPVDASFMNVPRCSPSGAPSYPLLNSPEPVDEVTLFDDQKLLDDPMLSSPSSWMCDNALSPFSDSFQREFFQMLE